MMHKPTVTVIIPTFNRERYIKETIDAIIGQTYRPTNILVIDDGSTDCTAEVIKSYGAVISYHKQENRGKAAALNLALRLADTQLIWICDDDDIPLPEALEWLVNGLMANSECSFSYGFNGLLEEKNGIWRKRDLGLPHRFPEPFAIQVLRRSLIYQPGLLAWKSCYDEVGMFNENMLRSQDYEMLLRLARRFKGFSVERIVFHQRVHNGVRGPAAAQNSASDRQKVWLHYDRKIFTQIHQDYELSEFAIDNSRGSASVLARQALITRAVIMARRGLWQLASADLAAALTKSKAPLSQFELLNFSSIFDWAGYAFQTVKDSTSFFKVVSDFPLNMRLKIILQMLNTIKKRLARARSWEQIKPISLAVWCCTAAAFSRVR